MVERMNHKPIILQSGIELPLTDLRGKPYLQVAYRLVWFREDHPDWTIETVLTHFTHEFAIVEAKILNEQGRLIAQDRKLVTQKSFQAYVEKATTGAIGRALALCGYGTQFDPEEFEEDTQPQTAVDSAVARPKIVPVIKSVQPINKREQIKSLMASANWSSEYLTAFMTKNFGKDLVSALDEMEYAKLIHELETSAMGSLK